MVNFLRCYGALLIVDGMLAAFSSAYVIAGITPSNAAHLITSWTFPIFLVAWVQADARSRRCTPCFDFGFFLLPIWTLSVPWYLIWTRGWRGVLVALMFYFLAVFPGVVANIVWIVVVMSVG